ncbi:MAG: cysteine--tRNA ligase [Kiritimatiellaeota bacterium]|nr:cysteine--tRNA ligase [Kiritimatiellota bacterium]
MTPKTPKLYNSLTRSKDDFTPLTPGAATMYTCGPTVYNFAHIGNFRAYMFEDILRRTLEFFGMKVTQVMNLTDVDDKTIAGSIASNTALPDFTRTYKDAFFADLRTLGVEPAEFYPAATDHIPEMIRLIEALIAKGVAYQAPDKSVYFSIAKFPAYGRLARLDRDNMRPGARVANDEYEKEGVGDFAIWKAWDEKDGAVRWDSPWGPGRPGWHIECSAMAMRYLGESFDIHTGGVDNLFPHHENEIAQAEAATGKPFAHTWLHCAHLRVNGEKMSKSAGNFFTLRDLLAKGYTGREIRFVLLSGHYRQPLNFTFDSLDAAKTSLARIDAFIDLCGGVAAQRPADDTSAATQFLTSFTSALADDLNVPEALASVHSLINHGNKLIAEKTFTPADATAALDTLRRMDTVLNVLFKPADEIPAQVQSLLAARAAARAAKQWAESDRIRAEIIALGWNVKDTPDGQKALRG